MRFFMSGVLHAAAITVPVAQRDFFEHAFFHFGRQLPLGAGFGRTPCQE
jgi:hypothetical protein